MATSNISSILNSAARAEILNETTVSTDDYIRSISPGVYQVSGIKSPYIPFQYGTLAMFISGGGYRFVLGVETDANAIYVRHANPTTWQSPWKKVDLTAIS